MTRSEDSSAIPFMLLVFLFVNVALVVVGWHVRQMRRAEYGGGGLDLSAPASTPKSALARPLGGGTPPPAEAPVGPAPERAAPAVLAGAPSSVVPERLGPAKPAPRAPAAAPSPLRAAARLYFKLKSSPRFRSSETIRKWKQEFLAQPDLRALDARYRRDGDAAAFLKGLARSPNLRPLLARHIAEPDAQAFVKELAAKPETLSAARSLGSDDAVRAALRGLKVPGLPSLDAAAPAVDPGMKKTSEAIRRTKQNSALKGMLEDGGAPGLDERSRK
ncbi:MAG: hypothetical protein WC969_10295 [Elusimicrobiota bacterium]